MGAVPIALQAIASHRRSIAMETAASAQAQATNNQICANLQIEKGQRQDRLKHAIEHLGHPSTSVRLGGAYELLQLARDTPSLRETVLNILCAHIRQTTTTNDYITNHHSSPTTEIQSILRLVFAENHELFGCYKSDLQGSYLNRANLSKSTLINANLERVRFQQANLHQANLRGALLINSDLGGAVVARADLSGAKILTSNLQRAILSQSLLRGATILGAKMQLVDLRGAQLQGAQIKDVQLQGAKLAGASFQGVHPMPEGNTSLRFVDIVRRSVGNPSDLSELTLQGSLNDDDMASLTDGLSEDDASRIRKDFASQLRIPGDADVSGHVGLVTGKYTNEDAETWIAEYLTTDKSAG